MRRSAVIYILLLAVLAGLYYYLNHRPQEASDATPTSTSPPIEYLFSVDDGLPARINIESRDGGVVEVGHNAENAWVLTMPTEAPADQGTVEAAVSQISTIRVLDHVPSLSKETVGLDDPGFTLTIQFSGGVERIIEVGVLTPTEHGYYVSRGDGDILIVGNAPLDTLLGLLTDPPYMATETPPPPTPDANSSP